MRKLGTAFSNTWSAIRGLNLMAFGLKADAKVTQVLVFKARSSTIKLKHFSGRVTINTAILGGADGNPDLAARTLRLNLFDDVIYTAVQERVQQNNSGSFS